MKKIIIISITIGIILSLFSYFIHKDYCGTIAGCDRFYGWPVFYYFTTDYVVPITDAVLPFLLNSLIWSVVTFVILFVIKKDKKI